MRKRKLTFAIAVTALLLVPVAVFGGPALAKNQGSSSAQYKVTICHHTHSATNPWVKISVSHSALEAHMKHGDFLVTDAAPCPPASGTSGSSGASGASGASGLAGPTHGNSGTNGDNGNHGNGKHS
jgi:hypothetical protein